jgi:hypothetical protein
MLITPPVVHNFKSNAERKIFKMLEELDLGKHAFALHSLNLTEHEYKRWAEIDFIIAWEEGVFALEIKGGRVSCHDGIWSFINRFGETFHKSEGPFDQAKTGHDKLKQLTLDNLPLNTTKSFCWGWGVVFPDSSFNIKGPSWSTEMVLDSKQLGMGGSLGLKRYLQQLAKWWRSQGKGHHTLANQSQLTELRQFLRPDFDMIPSISGTIDDVIHTVVRLTNEQFEVLDGIEENDRILCTGGAGTGKSFLAIETARRETAKGKNTIIACHSSTFASFIKSKVSKENITIADYESINILLANRTLFDSLIVDEAQDFLTGDKLSLLGQLLHGGLSQGRWRMFLDPNNQSGLNEPIEINLLEDLKKVAAKQLLTRNCRNTKEIVLQTQLLTAADIGVALIEGNGPPVDIIDIFDQKSTAAALEKRINDWLEEDVSPGHITILSPLKFEDSAVRLMSPKYIGMITTFDKKAASLWPLRTITYSTIINFKGLENRCIAIVDIESFSASPKDVATLYVAMTRAHAGLWLAVPQTQRNKLNQIIRKHTEILLTEGI